MSSRVWFWVLSSCTTWRIQSIQNHLFANYYVLQSTAIPYFHVIQNCSPNYYLIWKRNDVFVFHKKATHCTIGFHLPTNTSNSMGTSLRNHTNICPPQPKAVTMTCVNVIMTLVLSSEDMHTFLQRHSNYWGTFCAPLHWKWISWPPCHLSFASLKAIS